MEQRGVLLVVALCVDIGEGGMSACWSVSVMEVHGWMWKVVRDEMVLVFEVAVQWLDDGQG